MCWKQHTKQLSDSKTSNRRIVPVSWVSRWKAPFSLKRKKGAQNGAYLRNPDFGAFHHLYEAAEGLLRIVDVAAELPGAVEFTEKASRLCTVSIAHTDCTYEEASAVFDAGASHLTHLYNAMPGIHHRKPGPHRRRLRTGKCCCGTDL